MIKNSAEIYLEFQPEFSYEKIFELILKKYPNDEKLISKVLKEFF